MRHDVNNEEIAAQLFGQLAGGTENSWSVRIQVHRTDDVSKLWAGRGVLSLCGPDCAGAIAQCPFQLRLREELTDSSGFRRHHDQVDFFGIGVVDDVGDDVAREHHAAELSFIHLLGEEMGEIGKARSFEAILLPLFFDVQERQIRIETLRQSHDLPGERSTDDGEIGGEENVCYFKQRTCLSAGITYFQSKNVANVF